MCQIHYADVERGNESNPYDEWSETACGLELDDRYLSNRLQYVSCKNCLRVIDAHKKKVLIRQNKQLKN